jgi:hypothetical protein
MDLIDLQIRQLADSRSVPERHYRAALRTPGFAGILKATAFGGGSFTLSFNKSSESCVFLMRPCNHIFLNFLTPIPRALRFALGA